MADSHLVSRSTSHDEAQESITKVFDSLLHHACNYAQFTYYLARHSYQSPAQELFSEFTLSSSLIEILRESQAWIDESIMEKDLAVDHG